MNKGRSDLATIVALAWLTTMLPFTPGAAQEEERVVAPFSPGPIGNPAGSGPYPAIAEARADAPRYTIYRPGDLPRQKLPLVLWGNGGCRDNGLSASHFLREVASQGYFVIANGRPRAERPVLDVLPPAPAVSPLRPGEPIRPQRSQPDETSAEQMLAAIAWAEAADSTPDNKFYDHIDTERVAVMGHSCGGLQALLVGRDPRISTVVALNSGIYGVGSSPPGNVPVLQKDLADLHTPVAFILGGAGDMAYQFGIRNFELLDQVPVISVSLPVGHGGTFQLENGGEWARVATAWLDWQIKGSHQAARWFVGADCFLCRDGKWEVRRKHFPQRP